MSVHLKKITKALFIFGILVVSTKARAQQMDTVKVDPFTNDTTYSTTQANIASMPGKFLEAYLAKTKGIYYLFIRVDLRADQYRFFDIVKGDAMIIKLSDNSFINSSNVNSIKAIRQVFDLDGSNKDYWSAYAQCAVSYDEMVKIEKTGIAAIRVATDIGNVDFDVSDDGKLRIYQMATLILAH
jgi:hypothetical protein